MLRRSRLLAVLVSGLLGLGAAGGVAACGDSEGSRENPERGNQGDQSQGDAPSTVRTGPTTLGSTAPEATGVTQTQTSP